MQARVGLVVIAVSVAGCTPAASESAPSRATTTTTSTAPTTTTTAGPPPTTTTTARTCAARPPTEARIAGSDPAAVSVELSRIAFPDCVEEVVVAAATEAAMAAGAILAVDRKAPLLVVGDEHAVVRAEIERLRPRRVLMVGLEMERFPETEMVSRPVEPDAVVPETTGSALLLFDRASSNLSAVAAAFAARLGARSLEVPRDLRRVGADTRSAIQSAPSVALLGSFGQAAEWQLDVVRTGIELPGGGQVLFPGRRMVAMYGTPYAPGLGVLGEQSPEESVGLATELAAEYRDIDGTPTIPTFDLIATVATAGAGDDGDYSEELSMDSLRPWVDAAAEAGVYVVLDLQPGRADFLTQAKRYEELLVLPHVGLALDPEWRLAEDQFHNRDVGGVSAAEVNAVSAWLADLVRQNSLPQKLLVVHQFKFSMITERADLSTPAELAVVIQMDGQGPLATKYDTYDAITANTDEVGWRWGWKNFHDEDDPTATPEQTLAVEPAPVYVSYQ